MATRLLSGPTGLRGPLGEKGGWNVYGWWRHHGLLLYGGYQPTTPPIEGGGTVTGSMCRATLDGVCAQVGGFDYLGAWGWWPARNRFVSMYGSQLGPWEEYQIEPKAMVIQSCGPNDQPLLDPDTDAGNHNAVYNLWSRPYVKLPDRRLFFQGHRIWAVYPGQPAVAEGPTIAWVFGALRPGRSDTEVCLMGSQGIIFYDTVHQEFSSKIYQLGVNTSTSIYVPEHEIFIGAYFGILDAEYGYEDYIRVYSMETEPTSLSEVEVYDGELKSGQVVTYRVQALGTATVTFGPDDPAEGELIDWSITGIGTLLQSQTTTDADGWAYVQVQYLVDDVGGSTVNASLTC